MMNGMMFNPQMGTTQSSIQNPYMATVNPYANRFSQPYTNINMPVQNNGIHWVQGIEGAKAYQLPPNSNEILLDSDIEGKFYIKVSDNVGMCTLRVFDYVEVTNAQTPQTETVSQVDMSNYVTREELQKILSDINNGGNTNGKQPVSTDERNTKPSRTAGAK